jgi:glc operon protein GlcG
MSAPLEYGVSLTLAEAKTIMEAAEREAAKNNWPMVISIVDAGANLIMQHKMDHTQLGSITIARLKAETAVNFKRPTLAFEETLAKGGAALKILGMPNVTPLEGGLPVIRDGKVIGAVGVSGMASPDDAQVARAGIAALIK